MVPASAVLEIPNQLVNIHGRKEATMAPMPIKKLCIAKPVVRCEGGSISPTNARKGSMLMLMDASMIHKTLTAIQSADELGMKSKESEASKAPIAKKGLLRPHVLCQVRSL